MAAFIQDFPVVSGADLAGHGAGNGAQPNRELTALARCPEVEPGYALELTTLWSRLIAGEWFAWSGFCSAHACYLVLGSNLRAKPKLARRAAAMLELVLTGESQKGLAIDGSLAHSTVAARCASSLKRIGAEHTLSCVPTLYLLAAHAARGLRLGSAWLTPIATSQPERWLVSYKRFDGPLDQYLTEAECDVVRLLIEGRTHAQMALVRNRSKRTIANQLGSAFRKLGVSGRTALVAKLLEQQGLPADPDPERRLH